MRVKGRRFVLIAALTVVGVFPLAAAPATNLRITPPGAKKPTVFIAFTDGQLKAAPSAEALVKAKPVSASSSFGEGSSKAYSFPNTTLPGTGAVKVSAQFLVSARGNSKFINGTYTISQRDKAGALWTYTIRESKVIGTATPNQAPVITLPKIDSLAITVETKVEGDTVRAGIRPSAGKTSLVEINKNGKSIPAQMQIVDQKGKVVSDKKATIDTFGFT